jgi:hypothetical protein
MAMLSDFFPASMTTPSNPFAADTPVPWLAMSPWLSQAAPSWPAPSGAAAGVEPLPAPIKIDRPPGMLAPGVDDPNASPVTIAPASGPAPFSLSGGYTASSAAPIPANNDIPKGSLLDKIVSGVADNSDMLLGLASGLVGAPSVATGFSRGFQNAMAASASDDKRRSRNQTAAFLQSKGYSPEDAAVIAGNPAVLQAVLTQPFGKGATSDIQAYEYAKRQGFTGSLADWMAQKRGGAGRFARGPATGAGAAGAPAVAPPAVRPSDSLPAGFREVPVRWRHADRDE